MNVAEDFVSLQRGAIGISDSGLLSGEINQAADRQALTRHACGEQADSLRFYRNQPTASIGRHQILDREVRAEYCRAAGIAIVRRISGGGALYLAPDQIGWSLLLGRTVAWNGLGLTALLALFTGAVAHGLRGIGVPARYKYPNDLEIDGRKLGSLFIACEGDSLLLQGLLLVDADIRTMLEVLRTPTEKLSRDGLSAARHRLVTLRECLGEHVDHQLVREAVCEGLSEWLGRPFGPLAVEAGQTALPPDWREVANEALARLDWSDAAMSWAEALWKSAGATMRVRARIETGRIAQIAFGGDWHVEPADWPERLQQALRGEALQRAADVAEAFCAAQPVDMPGVAAVDWTRLLTILADKADLQQEIGLDGRQANALMLFDPEGAGSREILRQATVMLVPYCAKPAWCKWRLRDGCPECGLCEVGEAYRLARERSMQVTSIINYEHLEQTLAGMRADGVRAYVGMCCNSFFIKRQRAFRQAGIPALLMDISGANCYELKQEDLAYAGKFEAQAELDLDALQRVIRIVPVPAHTETGE